MKMTRATFSITCLGLGLAAGGCVNVSAPTRPIEINLNISVTQQVVLRYNEDARSVIQQNPGIF
ncbi:YnbE family lipoprotein [Sphingomonas sp.]|uniref:YnbE family lipoprotein n=1 Tax=Sphingomonas sp. TaxID=28214 RepID=UPI003CC5DF33